MGNLAALTHGAAVVVPGRVVRRRKPRCARSRRSAARRSTACRRCSSRSSSIRAFAQLPARLAANRHHGGRAVPDRGDAPGHRAHARAGGDDLLRHDRDLARVVPVRRSTIRSSRACRRSARVHPHVECKIVDPETGAIVPRGDAGELCTRGYSVMLGYWNNPEATARRDRRRGLDAHRRSRRHARRRLREHLRAASRT